MLLCYYVVCFLFLIPECFCDSYDYTATNTGNGVTIYTSTNTTFSCGTSSCTNSAFYCQNRSSCSVSCGSSACTNLQFYCSQGSTCTASCSGTSSCSNLIQKCYDSSSCSVTCGSTACSGGCCSGNNCGNHKPCSSDSPSSTPANTPSASDTSSSTPSTGAASLSTRPNYSSWPTTTFDFGCPPAYPSWICSNNTLYINSSLHHDHTATLILHVPVVVDGDVKFSHIQLVFVYSDDSQGQLVSTQTVTCLDCRIAVNISTSSLKNTSLILIQAEELYVNFTNELQIIHDDSECIKSTEDIQEATLSVLLFSLTLDQCNIGTTTADGDNNNSIIIGVVVGVIGCCILIGIGLVIVLVIVFLVKKTRQNSRLMPARV